MDIVLIWTGWVLLAIGVIGCFVPVLPGPPIAYVALLLAYATGDHSSPTVATLVCTGLITTAVTVLDYVVPAYGASKFNCSRLGTWGCFAGTIAGLFFLPFGVILGPFFGALVGEFFAGKHLGPALVGAFGALLGFLAGLVMKLLCCGFLIYVFWIAVYGNPLGN